MDSKALETMESIEMIAATIAHEVKNPLALIQVNVDFLELEDREKNHKKNYDIIKKEIKKVNTLIMDFINFIKHTYRFDEDVVIYDIVTEIIEDRDIYVKSNIEFKIDSLDKNLYFTGNRQLFTWVFSNLIKNSVEAICEQGFIEITAKKENGQNIITLKDSGCGLSNEELDKINNDEIYTSKKNGSGIGLDICKNIINEHSGGFKIEGFDDGGCLVTITIPAV